MKIDDKEDVKTAVDEEDVEAAVEDTFTSRTVGLGSPSDPIVMKVESSFTPKIPCTTVTTHSDNTFTVNTD